MGIPFHQGDRCPICLNHLGRGTEQDLLPLAARTQLKYHYGDAVNNNITIFRELRRLNCPNLCVLTLLDDGEREEEVYASGIDIRLKALSELHAEWLEQPVELWSCTMTRVGLPSSKAHLYQRES